MANKLKSSPRRDDALSRTRIIEAAIKLLDKAGERGLTFRALSEMLTTGPGTIYWHVANKSELLMYACDTLITNKLASLECSATPDAEIRTIALGVFAAMDEHPWIGSALLEAPGQLPTVRLFERIGQQVRELGVPQAAQWMATSALLHYILGSGGQNAANRVWAQVNGIDREELLKGVSAAWGALDDAEFPFTRSLAKHLQTHDDIVDFMSGIDLILDGLYVLAAPNASKRHAPRE